MTYKEQIDTKVTEWTEARLIDKKSADEFIAYYKMQIYVIERALEEIVIREKTHKFNH